MTLLTHSHDRSRHQRPQPPARKGANATAALTPLISKLRGFVRPAISILFLMSVLVGIVALKAEIFLARLNY